MKLFYTPNFFPSHITGSTKTLIDNIFSAISNNLLNKTPPANLTRTFSDHLPQALLVPGFYQYENVHKSNVFICDWKTFNNATFSADYKSADWPAIMLIDKGNPNLSFHNFVEEVEKMISNNVPLRKTRK